MTDETKTNGTNGLIRVEDHFGRLLFIYNPFTRSIEFVPMRSGKNQNGRRQKFVISTDELRAAGMRNVISDSPIHKFVVDDFEELE